MKHLFVLVAAPFALVAAPLAAQPLGAGEVELRIEALGDIAADSAIIPIQITGRGKDEAAAKSDLAEKEKDVRSGLVVIGIPMSKVELSRVDQPQYPVVESASVDYGCAAAAVATETSPVVTTDGGEPSVSCEDKTETKLLMVTVDDLTKLPDIAGLSDQQYDYYVVTSGKFFHRDPKAAHSAAIAEAIAKARADAEVYAAAMGLRVVRMVSVGNSKPKINWPDLIMLGGGFVSGLDLETAEKMGVYQLRALVAGQFAGVTIDFVLGPK